MYSSLLGGLSLPPYPQRQRRFPITPAQRDNEKLGGSSSSPAPLSHPHRAPSHPAGEGRRRGQRPAPSWLGFVFLWFLHYKNAQHWRECARSRYFFARNKSHVGMQRKTLSAATGFDWREPRPTRLGGGEVAPGPETPHAPVRGRADEILPPLAGVRFPPGAQDGPGHGE